MNNYWKNRWDNEKQVILNNAQFDTLIKVQKAYLSASKALINKLTLMYEKIIEEGGVNGVTQNMLYQYNRYYKMLLECQKELEPTGINIENEINNSLIQLYKNTSVFVGDQLSQQGIKTSFEEIDERAMKAVTTIWADDGKNWSSRIWENVTNLQEEFMNTLVSAIAIGDSAMSVEKKLMERFSVSFSKAKTLVQTEMSHIMNQSSIDRMKDAGIKEWEWYTAEDEKVCPLCKRLDGKRFPITDKHTPPVGSHPNCRCTVLAVL